MLIINNQVIDKTNYVTYNYTLVILNKTKIK